MSEENKPNKEKPIEEKEAKPDVISDNVALLKSKIINLQKDVDEKDALITALSEKLEQATAFVEADKKKMILSEVSPMVDIPDEILMRKSLDELTSMKNVLDVARVPVFKSGTAITPNKKQSARTELDSLHDNYMAKLRSGKN